MQSYPAIWKALKFIQVGVYFLRLFAADSNFQNTNSPIPRSPVLYSFFYSSRIETVDVTDLNLTSITS
jgi:hypothetical protein